MFIGDRVGGCLSCGMAGRDAVEEASARATSRGSLLSMSRFSRNTGSFHLPNLVVVRTSKTFNNQYMMNHTKKVI